MNDNDSSINITQQENAVQDNNSSQSEALAQPKPSHKSVVTGVVFGIVGLIIGGLGVFGVMKLVDNAPVKECPDCTCPKCPTKSALTSDLNTVFFALEPQGQNIIYSPLSIRYGLSLLDAGAAGTTKTEIDNVLGDTKLPKYKNIPDVLSLANAVFIKDDFAENILPSYTEKITGDYDAEVIFDDFSSTANMDNWVRNKTFNLINQIGVNITKDTKMVLANALAIQMDWQYQFEEDNTEGRTFYKADGSEIQATTMNKTTSAEDIKYHIDDNATFLSLPLESANGTDLDFVAVMPSGNLTNYIDNLDLPAIEETIANLTPASTPKDGVEIYIPKFKYEYELAFKEDLQSLGINQAFVDGDADFSNMTSDPYGIYVGQAAHKANIDFSEEGIKAAAVTAFETVSDSVIGDKLEPTVINIDHPFLFLIRDKADGTIWFIGAVYEPNLWINDASSYR